jgi:hypothetical protein
MPTRGFYMGVLPMPADDQSFEEVYGLAAQSAEFIPVWGKPSPYYELAADIQGGWGDTFLRGLAWEAGMFPLVHMSFIDAGMTLKTPPDLPNATLQDPAWRAGYQQAAIDIVSTEIPMYLSLGNEVNRWYEQHGADAGDPNGFQHFVSLYEETYDAVKAISPDTIVFCVFSREIVDQNRASIRTARPISKCCACSIPTSWTCWFSPATPSPCPTYRILPTFRTTTSHAQPSTCRGSRSASPSWDGCRLRPWEARRLRQSSCSR